MTQLQNWPVANYKLFLFSSILCTQITQYYYYIDNTVDLKKTNCTLPVSRISDTEINRMPNSCSRHLTNIATCPLKFFFSMWVWAVVRTMTIIWCCCGHGSLLKEQQVWVSVLMPSWLLKIYKAGLFLSSYHVGSEVASCHSIHFTLQVTTQRKKTTKRGQNIYTLMM